MSSEMGRYIEIHTDSQGLRSVELHTGTKKVNVIDRGPVETDDVISGVNISALVSILRKCDIWVVQCHAMGPGE